MVYRLNGVVLGANTRRHYSTSGGMAWTETLPEANGLRLTNNTFEARTFSSIASTMWVSDIVVNYYPDI